jgi:RNA polymerase sigma factor (sigma-70 family)
MSPLDGWDLNWYGERLRTRAQTLHIDARVQVVFDESDLAQATLMRAADPERPPCTGATDGQRLAWLFQIQERLLLDKYDEQFADKRDVRRKVDLAAIQAAVLESTADFPPIGEDKGPSPSEQAAGREELAILDRYFEQLSSADREVLTLRRQGLKIREIAERLGVSVAAAASRIAQASKRLMALSKKLRRDNGDG